MNKHFETNFCVLPIHTNWRIPLIFGGAFFSQLDLAAASVVRQALHESVCDNAVTFKFNGTFHAPSYMGDIIFITADIVDMRHKTISIKVEAYREPHPVEGVVEPKRIHVATADFVFVTMLGDAYTNHGLHYE